MFSKIHEIHVPLLLLVSLLMNLPSQMTLLLLALHNQVSLNEVSLNIITRIINPFGFKTLWTKLFLTMGPTLLAKTWVSLQLPWIIQNPFS